MVLGNRSVKHRGDDADASARSDISMCDVHDCMTAPRALAHNKFLVLCDADQTPQAVWTGSTNLDNDWSLYPGEQCGSSAELRARAGLSGTVEDACGMRGCLARYLLTANAAPRTVRGLDGTTLWFTPVHGQSDLEQAGEMIRGAKGGNLCLMFNPGPRGTLFNNIVDLAPPSRQHYDPDLYIQGVLNQDPGTGRTLSRCSTAASGSTAMPMSCCRQDPGSVCLPARGAAQAAAQIRHGPQQGDRPRPLWRKAGGDDGLA
jgi:hypothetical protein